MSHEMRGRGPGGAAGDAAPAAKIGVGTLTQVIEGSRRGVPSPKVGGSTMAEQLDDDVAGEASHPPSAMRGASAVGAPHRGDTIQRVFGRPADRTSRDANGVADGADHLVAAASSSGGAPLPGGLMRKFEGSLGVGLSAVRVHTSSASKRAADAVGAKAYTSGNDIHFGAAYHDPSSAGGEHLLAHEVAHTVQQAGGAQRLQYKLEVSSPGDGLEHEADRAADAMVQGQAAVVSPAGAGSAPVAAGTGVTAGDPPAMRIARQPTGTPGPSVPAPAPGASPDAQPPSFNVFEDPSAATPAGAPVAFDKYIKLSPADQERARSWSYSTGKLQKALAALGPANSAAAKYADAVHGILRWIEETETRKTTGKSDDQMAATQAGFIKAKGASPPGWGGTTTTRWAGLLPAAQKDWTDRGKKAITAMVTYAVTNAPELKLVEASFELKFEEIDKIALGALATGGSVPGKTVFVGFEFVATAEVNPAYALSTVVHELRGHPDYDEKSGAPNYAGKLYQDAAAKVPSNVNIDRQGDESFNYWPSEIYSLMKEIPYWTAVTPADAAKSLALPGGTSNAQQLNYDPRGAIEDWLKTIQQNWKPSLVNGIVRGFYKRVQNDAGMAKVSVTEFAKIINKVFAPADAAIILK